MKKLQRLFPIFLLAVSTSDFAETGPSFLTNDALADVQTNTQITEPFASANAYVSTTSNIFKAYDLNTGATIQTLQIGQSLRYMMLTPDRSTVYVCDNQTNAIYYVNTSNFAINSLAGYSCFFINKSLRFIYTTQGTNIVDVIDPSTNSIVGKITANIQASFQQVAVTSDDAFIYVGNKNQPSVYKLNVATGNVEQTITVPSGNPYGAAILPNNKKVYVGAQSGNTISVIDTATNKASAITVGFMPFNLVVSPDGTRLYVGNVKENTLSVIDTATDTVIRTIPDVGGLNPRVSSDGRILLVTSPTDEIYVIDTTTYAVTRTLSIPGISLGAAVA